MSGGTEPWRRPVNAHAEETLDFYHGEPQRSIKWYIDGEHQFEDAERMRLGLVCTECMSTFPASPDKKNIKIWGKYVHEWAPMRTKDEVIKLISNNLCPTCSSEVTPEMFALSYKGVDEFKAQPLKDIIDK